jgi:hypothetical protein
MWKNETGRYPSGRIALRNYQGGTNPDGTPRRVEGAALVYYAASTPMFTPRIYAELSMPIGGGRRLYVREGIMPLFHVKIENGWDRYNRLADHDAFHLVHVLPFNTSVGLRWHPDGRADGAVRGAYLFTQGGYVLYKRSLQPDAQGVDVTIPRGSAVFEAGMGVTF